MGVNGNISGYPTIPNFVYLGRVSSGVWERAERAGLKGVTVREFRKIHKSIRAMTRLMYCGTWYDTVRY